MNFALPRVDGFLNSDEAALGAQYLQRGYVIAPVADRVALDRLRDAMAGIAAKHLGLGTSRDPGALLDDIHGSVEAEALNALRMAVINGVNDLPWARQVYFELARPLLEAIVGNELAMQRRLNLSIQMPGDDSSLLAVHADVWDGDSPFEVVVWLPFVDCFNTKTMFLLPPEKGGEVEARMADFDGGDTDDLFAAIEDDLIWLDVPYGHVLLFNQNLMHGNRINREGGTRWTMNCRFKGLFSPYAGKR
ncbi:MAG: hypothetical protein HN478_16585, partial [Rhodospirillaceae bacterium]|nr:hypothetical protein [Rhodospirillaceae bacterium]